jgi:hypothetical protein
LTKARDLANASTALSAVSATELGFVDGVTSAIQTQIDTKLATATAATTYVANSLADAKGDIFVATADNTVTRLPVGNSGEQIVADSSTSTGLRYTGNFAAGKNKIINGDFFINQRNFTSNTTAGSYNFDRFNQNNGGTSGTLTITPQTFTLGAAPVAGYEGKNFVRCVTASGASTNTYAIFSQYIENVRTLAGQTATVSFWAKAASGTPKIALDLQQGFSGGSADVNTYAGQVTISTSWARYSITVNVPSISGKTIGSEVGSNLAILLWLSSGSDFNSRNGSMGLQNNTFDIWGVQLEAGSVATAFQTATGTIQGELAACQRYYYKQSGGDNTNISMASQWSSTEIQTVISFPVSMRTNPSAVIASGTSYYRFYRNGDFDAFNNLTRNSTFSGSGSVNSINLNNSTEISGTAGWAGVINGANASCSIAFDAEL